MNALSDILSAGPVARTLAAGGAAMLIAGLMLVRRRRRGRPAGWILLGVSAALHAVLIFGLRHVPRDFGSLASRWSAMTRDTADATADEPSVAPEPPHVAWVETPPAADVDPPPPSATVRAVTTWVADPPPSWMEDLPDVPTPDPEPVPDRSNAGPTSAAATPQTLAVGYRSDRSPGDAAPATDPADDLRSLLGDDLFAEVRFDAPQAEDAPSNAPRNAPPGPYDQRSGEAKAVAVRRGGGDEQTEAAVAAALRFLADRQSDDGSWSPSASMAGTERSPLGVHRRHAGGTADTALTGLATLAMLGAGHTHLRGEHAETVYAALAYLLRSQTPDGSLSGRASVYAATYAHGMAALAVAEAAAMTGDPSAVDATRRAVAHTLRLQHPATGGWRYTPGDPGDVSQLGWQAMMLNTAADAGIDIGDEPVDGIRRFLRACRTGPAGDRSAYRPGERPSHTMTAESLAVRLLLGFEVDPAERRSAAEYLARTPPGRGDDNLYDWYYTTIALHQIGGDVWHRWNDALKRRLLAMQSSDGSFPRDTVWGGYGGTFYTTAMGALCLEAYYRHGEP